MRRSAPWTCRSPVARTCRTSSTVAVVVHIDAHVRASDPDVSGAYSDIHSKLLQHSAATLAARPVLPCPVHGGPATLRPRTALLPDRRPRGRRAEVPDLPRARHRRRAGRSGQRRADLRAAGGAGGGRAACSHGRPRRARARARARPSVIRKSTKITPDRPHSHTPHTGSPARAAALPPAAPSARAPKDHSSSSSSPPPPRSFSNSHGSRAPASPAAAASRRARAPSAAACRQPAPTCACFSSAALAQRAASAPRSAQARRRASSTRAAAIGRRAHRLLGPPHFHGAERRKRRLKLELHHLSAAAASSAAAAASRPPAGASVRRHRGGLLTQCVEGQGLSDSRPPSSTSNKGNAEHEQAAPPPRRAARAAGPRARPRGAGLDTMPGWRRLGETTPSARAVAARCDDDRLDGERPGRRAVGARAARRRRRHDGRGGRRRAAAYRRPRRPLPAARAPRRAGRHPRVQGCASSSASGRRACGGESDGGGGGLARRGGDVDGGPQRRRRRQLGRRRARRPQRRRRLVRSAVPLLARADEGGCHQPSTGPSPGRGRGRRRPATSRRGARGGLLLDAHRGRRCAQARRHSARRSPPARGARRVGGACAAASARAGSSACTPAGHGAVGAVGPRCSARPPCPAARVDRRVARRARERLVRSGGTQLRGGRAPPQCGRGERACDGEHWPEVPNDVVPVSRFGVLLPRREQRERWRGGRHE